MDDSANDPRLRAGAHDSGCFAEFAALEREGWALVAARYADTYGRCTSMAIEPLLDSVNVGSTDRVLDIACGPGYAAAAAHARGAKASGLDFSAGMLAIARAAHPGVDFREGDAAALPWADASFDAVISNFGIHHVPDTARALAEARRVLTDRGRFAMTVWEPSVRSPGQRLLHEAVAAAGITETPLPAGPPAHAFAEPEQARLAFETAGFHAPEMRTIEARLRAGDARAALEVFRSGTVRLGTMLRAQSPEAFERIAREFTRLLEPWRVPGGVDVPLYAICASSSARTSARMARA